MIVRSGPGMPATRAPRGAGRAERMACGGQGRRATTELSTQAGPGSDLRGDYRHRELNRSAPERRRHQQRSARGIVQVRTDLTLEVRSLAAHQTAHHVATSGNWFTSAKVMCQRLTHAYPSLSLPIYNLIHRPQTGATPSAQCCQGSGLTY